MKGFPPSMAALIKEFSKMPGIGYKSAQRLAFYILKSPDHNVRTMSEAILNVKSSVKFCSQCNNLSDYETCEICSDPRRDSSVICVVETPNDVISIERSGGYKGVYHVLLGALSPLDGIGPKELKCSELIDRINRGGVKEVIIATDSNTEGEATALYLIKILRSMDIRITRIAQGIPVGGNVEHADQATLNRALDGRVPV